MLESLSLEGKAVVITGGGTGLGRAMVRDMARAGAHLMIAGRRSGPIEEAAAEAESLGVKAFSEATDVTDSAQVAALMKACMDRFGKIDVLLNNAGAVSDNVRKPIWEDCCRKGGMIQLSRVLAVHLARYGITANTIVPGFVPTGATDTMAASLPRGGEFLPTGKLGKPEDFGPLAVFLASAASDYMTGEMFIADGGGLAAGIYPTGHAPLIPLEA